MKMNLWKRLYELCRDWVIFVGVIGPSLWVQAQSQAGFFPVDLGQHYNKMEPGLVIAGRIEDLSGRPIAGVKITIKQTEKDEVGQTVLKEVETAVSGPDGVWKCANVPRRAGSLNFALTHPKFIPAEFDEAVPADGIENYVTRADLLASKAVMKMSPGIAVAGTVETEQSRPIERATVRFTAEDPTPGKPLQVINLQTDEHGAFELVRYVSGEARLAVFATGYAPAWMALEVKPGLANQRFTLKTGATIQGRVTDSQGQLLANAKVVATWNNFALPEESMTDTTGHFQIKSAPLDLVTLRVSKDGYADSTVLHTAAKASSGGELKITLAKVFEFSGKVVDAEDGTPVKAFTLVRGRVMSYMLASIGSDESISWETYDRTKGADGAFSVGLGRGQSYPDSMQVKFKFLIQAEGYLPAISPALESKGWHQHDFKLKKGQGPSGVVLGPEGERVEGAEVATLGLGYVSLGKATISRTQDATSRAKTDRLGEFLLPALLPSPSLVVVHSSGIAEVSHEQLRINNFIRLQKWGRVEGVAKAGTKPWANQEIMLASTGLGRQINYDTTAFKITTDAEGRFVMENVPPGERQLARMVKMTENSWSYSDSTSILVNAGQTVRVTFGGIGRPIIGKLALSDPNRKVDFNSGFNNFGTRFPQPPAEYRTSDKIREWQKQPAYQEAVKKRRSYGLRIEDDGSFRVENVVPGSYDLRVQLMEPGQQPMVYGRSIGSLNQEVIVEDIPGGVSDEPMDLGVLTIQTSK